MENKKNKEIVPIREFIPFYFSYYDSFQELEDTDRLAMYDGITSYGFYGNEPVLKSAIARACWKLIKPLLEKSRKNYENGIKGGAPKGSRNNPNGRRGKKEETNQELTEELTETNQELSYKENDKDKENVLVSNKPKPRTQSKMKTPSLDEVVEYMISKGCVAPKEEAEKFIDYYDAKGWVIGKAPMKRWRSAVNTWLRNVEKYSYNTDSGINTGVIPKYGYTWDNGNSNEQKIRKVGEEVLNDIFAEMEERRRTEME